MVRYLATTAGVDVTETILSGVGPLHMACSHGNLEVRVIRPRRCRTLRAPTAACSVDRL